MRRKIGNRFDFLCLDSILECQGCLSNVIMKSRRETLVVSKEILMSNSSQSATEYEANLSGFNLLQLLHEKDKLEKEVERMERTTYNVDQVVGKRIFISCLQEAIDKKYKELNYYPVSQGMSVQRLVRDYGKDVSPHLVIISLHTVKRMVWIRSSIYGELPAYDNNKDNAGVGYWILYGSKSSSLYQLSKSFIDGDRDVLLPLVDVLIDTEGSGLQAADEIKAFMEANK